MKNIEPLAKSCGFSELMFLCPNHVKCDCKLHIKPETIFPPNLVMEWIGGSPSSGTFVPTHSLRYIRTSIKHILWTAEHVVVCGFSAMCPRECKAAPHHTSALYAFPIGCIHAVLCCRSVDLLAWPEWMFVQQQNNTKTTTTKKKLCI